MIEMNVSRYNKWLSWLLKAGFILVSAVIVGLRAGIWYSERTATRNFPENASSAFFADQDYLVAISHARDQLLMLKEERQVPGLSIAVTVKNKLVWSEGAGYADVENRTPVTPQTQFRINSVSKLFTASLAIKLVEQGKLSLDRDIREYIPEFPDKGHVITTRHLASHRSGIRSYHNDNEAVQIKNYRSVNESLDMFKNDTLVFEPGSDFLYSGFGYVLLSAVLEKAGEQGFLTLMEKEIFQPLNMKDTRPALLASSGLAESKCYDNVPPYSPDGSLVNSPPNDFSFKWAAGGFVSTALDLTRFGNAHIDPYHEYFIQKESTDILFQPHFTQAGLLHQGLGWMTARDLHLRKACFHFGAGSGGTSLLAIFPRQQMCLALVGNLGHAKFPFNRLINIANEFLYSPLKVIFNLWAAFAGTTLLFILTKNFRKR